jgi:hypothetical protein
VCDFAKVDGRILPGGAQAIVGTNLQDFTSGPIRVRLGYVVVQPKDGRRKALILKLLGRPPRQRSAASGETTKGASCALIEAGAALL